MEEDLIQILEMLVAVGKVEARHAPGCALPVQRDAARAWPPQDQVHRLRDVGQPGIHLAIHYLSPARIDRIHGTLVARGQQARYPLESHLPLISGSPGHGDATRVEDALKLPPQLLR